MANRARLRDLGVRVGRLAPGPLNAITDIPGVEVGYTTLTANLPAILRTGVTVIWPGGRDVLSRPMFAGIHSFNGNGEMTGSHWIAEQGLLTTPIAITNTHSVGLVRDAVGSYIVRHGGDAPWMLPVAAETFDGTLSDAASLSVTMDHVFAALETASGGAIAEGNVGGGTGMICNEFKGGIGTSSRVLPEKLGGYTVGVLVQCNYGRRSQLRIAGVPVGKEIPDHTVREEDIGSIIIVIATDAPLIPTQIKRLARRAALGLGRDGSFAGDGSGDIFIAFSTANPGAATGKGVRDVKMLPNEQINPIFLATVQATEEAIINAMIAAETMKGANDLEVIALPHDRLREVLKKYNRLAEPH